MGERVLEADCGRCAGLCCVAPAFAKSSDFAIDKAPGRPCPNLDQGSFRCTIHTELDRKGFHGCVVFDCFGAGQRITQEMFGGRSWRDAPEMLELLPVVRPLHELMWLLTEALKLDEAAALHDRLRSALEETERLAGEPGRVDVDAYRGKLNPLLQEASRLARGTAGPDFRGANLIGRRMRGADLRGASLRGALLIGADLRGADLRRADFTGADLRGADLRGADLTGALFLTAAQLRAAVV